MRRTLTFLTRPGCGLCDKALPEVKRVAGWLRCRVDVVDITTDSDLEAAYHLRIPVILNSRGDVVTEGVIGRRQAFRAVWGAFR
ncbi:MAG: glutaredoxin family protein [bacterium]|nr:glutaredoxin family protein [bacterium]MCP4964327.1 glutaredoxin family protein [bacterium]